MWVQAIEGAPVVSSSCPEPSPPMPETKVGHLKRFLSLKLLHGTASTHNQAAAVD